eukprot:6315986-Pyramimonas_sp.AAC.1
MPPLLGSPPLPARCGWGGTPCCGDNQVAGLLCAVAASTCVRGGLNPVAPRPAAPGARTSEDRQR